MFERGRLILASEQVKHTLIDLYATMKKNKDEESSRKVLELYNKQQKNEYVISFAGHFSAGKSSMINALLDKDLLPNSPIPTSANIVKLTSGGGYARMYFHEQEPVQYNEPYDMDMVRSFCKDKTSISVIEMSTSEQILPPHTALFDTPGIDAADDADRLMTEGSLHIADVLFYVMDYNHVQSEVNLTFLQELKEKNIPYYIIVNQIDKHNEEEISFRSFDNQIMNTFERWGIEPEELFYTSLKDPHAHHNMFSEVKEKIQELFESTHQVDQSIARQVQEVINQHEQFLAMELEDNLLEYGDIDANEDERSTFTSLQKRLQTWEESKQSFEDTLFKEVSQTLSNAQLMPFDMREHARLYLESIQPQFKIGLIGAKKKTVAEQTRRKETFLQALQSIIESAIQWNVRDKIKKLSDSYKIPHGRVDPLLTKVQVDVTEELIRGVINPGAQVTGEYVLRYTKELQNEVHTRFRRQIRSMWDTMKQYFVEEIDDIRATLQENEAVFARANQDQREMKALENSFQQNVARLHACVIEPTYDSVVKQAMEKEIDHLFHSYTLLEKDEVVELTEGKNEEIGPELHQHAGEEKKHYRMDETTEAIDRTIQVIQDIPGFSPYIEDLVEKKDRLHNRSLTVALFGAFSAGKSSFANALLGDALLPSSPNPTTAVITKIAPVTSSHSHGSVVISLKSEEEMAIDLRAITKEYSPPEGSFSQLIAWVEEKGITQDETLQQMYRSYIDAMVDGYTYMKVKVGNTEQIDLDRFASYATDETKACYIKEINVYYDCSITQKGITLVDTPGADSVNARHTNISFEYIKEADAILYVTYYNHALSRADKDFLMQLGRVKESFELDKMFFIINAADLASNQEELQLVQQYVEEQLIQLGIRFPSIFPISSKRVLEEKTNGNQVEESYVAFLESFYSFLDEDLPALTMEAASIDMKRVIGALDGAIHYAYLDGEQKEKREKEMTLMEEEMIHSINDRPTGSYIEQIENRIERQLYYVIERIGIRFHDFFKETFNPTTVTQSGKKGQEEIYTCMNELLRYSGFEFVQEIQAIALRVEAEVTKQLMAHYEETKDQLQSFESAFLLPVIDKPKLDTPHIDDPFGTFDYKAFQSALKYAGMKAFFVQNDKDRMRDDIYDMLKPSIESYTEQIKQMMRDTYVSQWTTLEGANNTSYMNEITSYIAKQKQMLYDVVDVEMLERKREQLNFIESKETGGFYEEKVTVS